ncbi:hypothetical protein E4T48_04416 [Aureobasidium sp. EXF-10727]|nr:hypothetical protein E4T48_04416 [Aureobasidium sp. EXF-10727]
MQTHLLSLPILLCFVAHLVGVSSSPVVERAAATCSANDIATVKRTTPDSVYFCQWWQQALQSPRTASPFMEFSPTQVDALCKCISPIATGGKCKRKRKRSNIEERADAATTRSASSCSSEPENYIAIPEVHCIRFDKFVQMRDHQACFYNQQKDDFNFQESLYHIKEGYYDCSEDCYNQQKGFDNDQTYDSPEACNNQHQEAIDDKQHQEAIDDKQH